MKNQTIICIVRFLAKVGQEADLMEKLTKLLDDTKRNEKGCSNTRLMVNRKKPEEFCISLSFSSYDQYRNHFDTAHVKDFVENHSSLLVQSIDQELYDSILEK